MAIDIAKTEDWDILKREGLTTVLDPMIFRCGELFLKGQSGVGEPAETWDLLSKNTHAIAMFFDYLILAEKLPVFNYADTFDMGLNFDKRTLTRINDYETVLHDVNVGYDAYRAIKQAALAELVEMVTDPTKSVSKELADDILKELSAADYRWSPKLEDADPGNEGLTKIYQFLLGGMIFGGYADQMESEHVLQPKRSRLILAVALRSKSAGYGFEEELFKELKKRSNVRAEDLPWRPSLFPYLLSKADTPAVMITLVAELRKAAEVLEYREWMNERIRDWKHDGMITFDARRDIEAVARLTDYVSGALSSMPEMKVKATLADVAGIAAGKVPVPLSVDLTAPLARLVGWGLSSVPGKRFRKLLSRALVADLQYVQIENRIKTVWTGG